jgi:diguanylate cyclase (GGDEF)-like protein
LQIVGVAKALVAAVDHARRTWGILPGSALRWARRVVLWLVAMLLVGLMLSAPARADSQQLAFQQIDCQRDPAQCPAQAGGNWTWFTVETSTLKRMPSGWNLLIDNTRFTAIQLQVAHGGNVFLVERGQFELAENWSLGNNLRFRVPVAGAEVSAVRIGFRNMDSPSLMRSVKAMDEESHDRHVLGWTVLIALVIGVLFSAFAYNVFLLTWLKTSFQRWYVVWVASALCYLLVWTGAMLNILPFLAGPASARTSFLLIGLLLVSGAAFFFALMENGKVPQRLVDFGQLAGIMVAITSVVAAFDMVFPARFSDLMMNLAMIGVILTLLTSCVFAAIRGSRAVWFYIIGWAPALAILGMRIARNFGLLPQDDFIDQAGFATIGWESLLLSLAIADRFRQLRRDADAADAERETLLRYATTDPLTGLGNRALFQNLLEQPAIRQGGIDVIAVDIDYLKQTNDMAGHDAGDALIVAVAERLSAAAGPLATIARIGGDEFVILLEGAARSRLPALRQMIALSAGVPLRHAGYDLSISICAGHAASEERGVPMARIFKQADLALYAAKAAGRGCWRSYDDSMADEAFARSRLISEARTGMATGQFRLHYQPVQRIDGRVVGHEALLRWQHPRLGLLAPPDFSDVMKEASILPGLQLWVLDTALAQAAQLRANGTDLGVAVNFLTGQLQGTAAAVAILDDLARHLVPPHALIVEVTENVVMGGLGGALIECLECLRDAGVHVALDDFGTGAGSLVHLREVPADIVKIDRSFVAAMVESDSSQQIVRALVDLAHSLGKQVVAEGVETDAQCLLLRQMGCDMGQGRLFGEPVPQPLQPAAAAA